MSSFVFTENSHKQEQTGPPPLMTTDSAGRVGGCSVPTCSSPFHRSFTSNLRGALAPPRRPQASVTSPLPGLCCSLRRAQCVSLLPWLGDPRSDCPVVQLRSAACLGAAPGCLPGCPQAGGAAACSGCRALVPMCTSLLSWTPVEAGWLPAGPQGGAQLQERPLGDSAHGRVPADALLLSPGEAPGAASWLLPSLLQASPGLLRA